MPFCASLSPAPVPAPVPGLVEPEMLPQSPWHHPPPSRILPSDGLQFCDPDLFWEYQFEMALNVESELRMFLATLVTFHQTRKLAHFLGYFADVLELTLWKNQDRYPTFLLRFDFPRVFPWSTPRSAAAA